MLINDQEIANWQHKFELFWASRPVTDSAHDIHHFRRVWRTAQQIIESESQPINALVVMAGCYLHDVVSLPKNHPDRHRSSYIAAQESEGILRDMSFPEALIQPVCHTVLAHSYSANIVCETIEAEVVQDADRMESLGAIGLARVFYTAGKLDSAMFNDDDPWAEERDLDDRAFAIDHFPLKLLTIAETMKTESGKCIAQSATQYLKDYLSRLGEELNGEYR